MIATMKAFLTRVLIQMQSYGPTAVVIAERLAHGFGICLGVH
jgi:hypothetical protein